MSSEPVRRRRPVVAPISCPIRRMAIPCSNSSLLFGFGFGNFSYNGCIKKIKGPVLKIKKELERKCKVVSVDEFRTSKLCPCCKCELEHRKSHKTRTKKKIKKNLENGIETKEIKNENIHSVLYCKNNNCSNFSITVDRDFSAVLNILERFYCDLKSLINPAFSRKRDLKVPFVVDPIYNFTAFLEGR